MFAKLKFIRRSVVSNGRVCACAVALTLLAGCRETPRDDQGKSADRSSAEGTQPAASVQTAAAPTAPAQPAQPAATPDQPAIGPDVSVATEADREALAKLILAQAQALQQANAAQEQGQPGAPTPPEKPAGPAEATTQPAPASQPGAAKSGCGPSLPPTVDITPLPLDQPQPKLVVKQAKVKAENVWAGKPVTWSFELANQGEGPLAIRLIGG